MNDLQRTDAWFSARLGKLTGSRIAEATAKVKNGASAGRKNVIADLAIERSTGQPLNSNTSWKSGPMQDGIDREGDAIVTYEFERNVSVELVGFIDHPRIDMAGCSPDGLVISLNGTVSVKCPQPAQHKDILKYGAAAIGLAYTKQLQWELGVTGCEFCDFISFSPLFKMRAQIKIIRVMRDEKMIAELEKEAREILAEVAMETEFLRKIEEGEEYNPTLEQLKASKEALSA